MNITYRLQNSICCIKAECCGYTLYLYWSLRYRSQRHLQQLLNKAKKKLYISIKWKIYFKSLIYTHFAVEWPPHEKNKTENIATYVLNVQPSEKF